MSSIIEVNIDTHRWYSVITIVRDDGSKEVAAVIGIADDSGLCEFDSVEDFEASI